MQAFNAVITSTLSVHSHEVHMLFDPGYMHSYISLVFAKCLSKLLAQLKEPFLVAHTDGKNVSC